MTRRPAEVKFSRKKILWLPKDVRRKQPEFVFADDELDFKLIRPFLRAKPWMLAKEIESMQPSDRFELLVRKKMWLLADWVGNPARPHIVRNGNNNRARADFSPSFSLCDLKVVERSCGC